MGTLQPVSFGVGGQRRGYLLPQARPPLVSAAVRGWGQISAAWKSTHISFIPSAASSSAYLSSMWSLMQSCNDHVQSRKRGLAGC